MPARPKIKLGSVEPIVPIEATHTSFGSFFFWLVILALCAGGYWYYQYMETQNEEHRRKRELQAAENVRIREENAAARAQTPQASPSSAPVKSKPAYGPQDGSGMGSVHRL